MTTSEAIISPIVDDGAADRRIALIVDEDAHSRAAMLALLEDRGYEVFPGSDASIVEDLTIADCRAVRLVVASRAVLEAEGGGEALIELFPLMPVIEIVDGPASDNAPCSPGAMFLARLTRPLDPEAVAGAIDACRAHESVVREVMRRHVFESQPEFMEEPIARIIHDLNNQITGLKGGIDLLNYSIRLMQDRETQQKFSRYMEQFIQPSLGQIEHMIRTWRRLRESRMLPLREVDLTVAAREAISLACCPLHRSITHLLVEGREVPLRGDGEGVMAACNRGHLVLALARILENAYDAVSNIDSPRIEVEIDRHGEGMCRVRVSDNGPGIPPDLRREVWRSFYSGKEDSRMGMGLSIAKQLVDKHQGQIDCVDGPLGGACVQILIPEPTGEESPGE